MENTGICPELLRTLSWNRDGQMDGTDGQVFLGDNKSNVVLRRKSFIEKYCGMKMENRDSSIPII